MRIPWQNISMEGHSPDTGAILIAHPSMQDPTFRRTVLFLAAHEPGEGSLGLVMNRALNKTLGETDLALSSPALAGIPLYEGGPVAQDKLILAAWRWVPDENTFQLYFGIDSDKAERLMKENSDFLVRGFLGHAGWTEGQLDAEVDQRAWLLSRRLHDLMEGEGEEIWRSMLLHESPEMRLLLDAPDDPSLN